jgi:hypothetical protein
MKFEMIKKIRIKTFASKEIGYQVTPGRSVLTSALVKCPCCRHEWVASEGGEPGEFLPGAGSERPIACPECRCKGTLSIS